jgi:hypothetical protein
MQQCMDYRKSDRIKRERIILSFDEYLMPLMLPLRRRYAAGNVSDQAHTQKC